MKQEILQQIRGVMDKAVAKNNIPGANLLVEYQGEEQFYYECGYQNIAQKMPIQRDTLFRLYSMTKPITGAATMLLLEQGALDLAEPVSDFLPGFREQKCYNAAGELGPVPREVTIKDLLGMTSGISYGKGPETPFAGAAIDTLTGELVQSLNSAHPMSTAEFANRIGECPLEFAPGERWQYGWSADVLGAVLEVVSGKPLEDFLQDEFFTPLGMKDTGFYVPADKQHRLATAYQETNRELIEFTGDHLGISNQMAAPPAFSSGGAGLVSTIDDYLQFARMLLRGGTLDGRQILSPQTVKFFTSSQLMPKQMASRAHHLGYQGYGYGNLMRVLLDSGQSVSLVGEGEYGWDGWLGCYFSNDPHRNTTVLFMTQRVDSGALPVTRKARNLIATATPKGTIS